MSRINNSPEAKSYDKLIKVFQILSVVFMLSMIIAAIVLMKKYDISVSNAAKLSEYLTGGTFTMAVVLIVFCIVKSFALVVSPSYLFIVSGMVFESVWVAVAVNFVATTLSAAIPYYLGRFTGKGMVDTLTKRFPKVKKLDDFADKNDFIIVLLIKAAGFLPSDITSLIFGAMGIPFFRFLIASCIGVLPINIMWTLVGNKGDLSNPYTYLYLLPVVGFAIITSLIIKKVVGKTKQKPEEPADCVSVD